jgi:hypothetical protein
LFFPHISGKITLDIFRLRMEGPVAEDLTQQIAEMDERILETWRHL